MKKDTHSKSDSSANQEVIDSYDFMSNAASSQDCTGLIPAGPVDEEELKSYEAVSLPATQSRHKEIRMISDFLCPEKNLLY